MVPLPTGNSRRDLDTGVATRKTTALVVAIITITSAAAVICFFASRHVQAQAHAEPDQSAAHRVSAPAHRAGAPEHALRETTTAAPEPARRHEEHKHHRVHDRETELEEEEEVPHHNKSHHNESHHNESHHNESRHNRTHDHDHKTCKGGPAAACSCILSCDVFGANPEACDGHNSTDKRLMVDKLIQKSMQDHHDMCNGMRCIKKCAELLGCLDEKVRDDCALVEKNYELHRRLPEPGCDLRCTE